MKKHYLKKSVAMLAAAAAVASMSFGGCSGTEEGTTPSNGTVADGKEFYLNAMEARIDEKVWEFSDDLTKDESIGYYAVGSNQQALLGITYAKEDKYQHPYDMIYTSATYLNSNPEFQINKMPEAVTVGDDEWYEWEYQYKNGATLTKGLARTYGCNYYAYSITYLADETVYNKYVDQAKAFMESAEMDCKTNVTAEKDAVAFLKGDWSISGGGVARFNEDGTYEWYMSDDENKDNYHFGKYYGDLTNTTMSGKDGCYLVLYPEKIFTDGKEGSIDVIVHFAMGKSDTEGSYDLVNNSGKTMFLLTKK